jgi:AraC-like DNA-binding protein
MKELGIHEVFTQLRPGESIYAGVFNSEDYPYQPASPVRCNYYSAMLILKGKGFLVVDHHEHEVKPGRLFVFANRQVIGWGYYENTRALVLALDNHAGQELGIRHQPAWFDVSEEQLPVLSTLLQHCADEFKKHDAISQSILLAAATHFYQLLQRLAGSPDVNDPLLAAFRNLIAEDFTATPSLTATAKKFGCTARTLNNRCLSRLGITAKQYMIDLKLTEAKRLLAFSTKSFAEVAYQTGFDDPSYFTRLFRKKTGFTPTAFRQKYAPKP